MEISNCCGATRWYETDICSECLEHADFHDEDENEDDLETEYYQNEG